MNWLHQFVTEVILSRKYANVWLISSIFIYTLMMQPWHTPYFILCNLMGNETK